MEEIGKQPFKSMRHDRERGAARCPRWAMMRIPWRGGGLVRNTLLTSLRDVRDAESDGARKGVHPHSAGTEQRSEHMSSSARQGFDGEHASRTTIRAWYYLSF